jgi:hypothetical protein
LAFETELKKRQHEFENQHGKTEVTRGKNLFRNDASGAEIAASRCIVRF